MSSLSSKQVKSHAPAGMFMVWAFIVAIVVLLTFSAGAGSLNNPLSRVFGNLELGGANSAVPDGDGSFASDEQYWSANCSHGWLSDSMCNDIVSRAQLCVSDVTSAYCSDYDEYMQQYYNRRTVYVHY